VLREFSEVRSIHWAENASPAEVTNLPTRLLWGEEAIEERLCGLRFRVRPNAFLQTNTRMAERIYELARELGAPRIVYVSCNPTTLASDVKTLRSDYGYELERARPVDMFPHTPHVETVALIEKRDG